MPRQKLATSELAAASLGEMMVTQDRLEGGPEVETGRCSVGMGRAHCEGRAVRACTTG